MITVDLIKSACRQTKDGQTITFVLHPNDDFKELILAAIGSQFKGVLIPLDDDGNAAAEDAAKQVEAAHGECHLSELVVANGDDRYSNTLPITESPGRGSPQGTPARAPKPNRLTQQAGICCGDPRFRAFLASYGMGGDNSPEQAAVAVRLICGVSSRREIVVGSPAAAKWDELYSKFIAWRDVAR